MKFLQLRTELLKALEEASLATRDTKPGENFQLEPFIDQGDEEPSSMQSETILTGQESSQALKIVAPHNRKGSSNGTHTAAKGNPGIHPRNIYASEEPNFAALAAQDPKLRPFVVLDANKRGSINFTDPDACRSDPHTPYMLQTLLSD